jgi:hypothetical protein
MNIEKKRYYNIINKIIYLFYYYKMSLSEIHKIFKSASLTFFSKNRGFLLCKEHRDHRLVFHPIGGKYEKVDQNIEKTAAREFVEETGIIKNEDYKKYIQNKLNADFLSCPERDFQNRNINHENINYQEEMINILYNLLDQECTYYFDYYVNKERYYVHRYYLMNIDMIEDQLKVIFEKIDEFYNQIYSVKKNEYIDSLVWNKDIIQNKHLNKRNYSMLTIYLSSLLKNVNQENN